MEISNSRKTTSLEHIWDSIIKTEAMDYGNTTIKGEKIHFFRPSGKKDLISCMTYYQEMFIIKDLIVKI